MKKLAVLAVLFLVGMTAQANQVTNLDHSQERGIRYNSSKSIQFVQRGVTFIVHSNGTFTYRASQANNAVHNVGRRSPRTAPGHTYGVSYANTSYSPNVSYNSNGQIARVGRNIIRYNRYGTVQSIGNVRLRYNNGCLVRAGNMHIQYNSYGRIINTNGNIY